MSNNQDTNRESPRRASFPPQPYQLIGPNHTFTPYFINPASAHRFPGQATPYLWNGLHHPAQEFPTPRNPFPGSDAIMEARKGDGEKTGVLSYEQVAALKDVKELSAVERHARDAKEFSASPPEALSQAQKMRWVELFGELLGTKEDPDEERKDPHKMRPRGELRKLKELAELAGGKGR